MTPFGNKPSHNPIMGGLMNNFTIDLLLNWIDCMLVFDKITEEPSLVLSICLVL